MINGSINGLIFGLFLGLILDSLTLNESFTQVPGLIFCGFLFGRIKFHSDILVGHFRYGLICSFGSFLCGSLYFLQILFRNFSDSNFLILIPSFKNILAEVFLTGLFAPFICSQLMRMFKFSRRKYSNKFCQEEKVFEKIYISSNYLKIFLTHETSLCGFLMLYF